LTPPVGCLCGVRSQTPARRQPVPRKPPKPKAKTPNLAELEFEEDDPAGLGILDDDGNMVLRRAAKPRTTKGKPSGKGKAK
jgi:hypothetical protein